MLRLLLARAVSELLPLHPLAASASPAAGGSQGAAVALLTLAQPLLVRDLCLCALEK